MPNLYRSIISDLNFYGGKGLLKKVITLFFKPSFLLMLNYRLGNYLFYHRFLFAGILLIVLKHRQLKYRNCHISYEAKIGNYINLPHPVGIVIGKGVHISDSVTIYQNCTFGQKEEKQYPFIGKGSVIYPSSIVIGGINLGNNVIVGAQSFVNKSIPENTTFYNK